MSTFYFILAVIVAAVAYELIGNRGRWILWLTMSIIYLLSAIAHFVNFICDPNFTEFMVLIVKTVGAIWCSFLAQVYYNKIRKTLSPLYQRIQEENERHTMRRM